MSLSGGPTGPSPKSYTLPLTLVVVIAVVAAGLSIVGTATYFELVSSRSSPVGSGTVQVTDDAGRTVAVPSDAGRVVVFGANIVDSMVRLDLRGHLVGVDCSSATFGGLLGDYTQNQTQAWNLTAGMCVQAFPTFNVEELLNLSPSLVVSSTIVSISLLEEVSATDHIPVLILAPSTLGGIVVDVQILAQVFPTGTAAVHLEAQLLGALANATNFVQNLTSIPNATIPSVLLTYYVDPSQGYYTYGPQSFGESLISLAGGTSISASASVPYPILSGAVVLAATPSVIVYGIGPLGEPLSAYQQGPYWNQFTSQKFGLDVTLFTEADPGMILQGLSALTAILHPGAR